MTIKSKMTRKEAIEICKELRRKLHIVCFMLGDTSGKADKFDDALSIVIKDSEVHA